MSARKRTATRFTARLVAGSAAIAVAFCAGNALAGSPATKLCMPEKPGKPIKAPLAGGACSKGYRLAEVGAEGPAGPEGKQGSEGPAGKEGPEGKVAGMVRWRTTIDTAGTVGAKASTVLAEVGPFAFTGKCWTNEGVTRAVVYVESHEDGARAQGYGDSIPQPLEAGQQWYISKLTAEGTPSHGLFVGPSDDTWAAEAHDGSITLDGTSNQAVWPRGATGPACSFSGYIVSE